MIIRDTQIESFIAANESELVTAVCEALIRTDRERTAGIRPLRLLSIAKIGIAKAREAGFSRPEDLAVYVALMLHISPDFAEHPAIAAVLGDTNFPLSERLRQLAERVPDAAWDEAEAKYDPQFWIKESAAEG
ncbi:MAG: hypothetical protein C4325_07830 [Blastocatellia bacterium]